MAITIPVKRLIEPTSTSYTVTKIEDFAVYTNLGAPGALTFQLPEITGPDRGLTYTFIRVLAPDLLITPFLGQSIRGFAVDATVRLLSQENAVQLIAARNVEWFVQNIEGKLIGVP